MEQNPQHEVKPLALRTLKNPKTAWKAGKRKQMRKQPTEASHPIYRGSIAHSLISSAHRLVRKYGLHALRSPAIFLRNGEGETESCRREIQRDS